MFTSLIIYNTASSLNMFLQNGSYIHFCSKDFVLDSLLSFNWNIYKCLFWLYQLKRKEKKRNVAAINFLDFPFIVYVAIFSSIIPAPPLVNSHDLFKAGLLYLPPKLDLSLTVKLLSFSLLNIAKHNKKKM